ncbi:MAG: hypothetical protein ACP5U0_08590 [Caldisphaera sp.]
MTKRNIIIIGILINLLLCFLPVYDTGNIYAWIGVGLSIHRNLPPLYGNLNPAPFFALMIYISEGYAYTLSQNVYISVIVLKLIILTFFILFFVLMDRIFEHIGLQDNIKNFLLALILLNPGILFINLIWVELEIIPVFFVTLSYYLVRFTPFMDKTVNNVLSVISLMISVFLFLYPIIFIPSIIMYTKGRKNRIILLLLYVFFGFIFLALQVKVYQGYFYNYTASLTGSNRILAPSGLPTGLFYYFHMVGEGRLITEIGLLAAVSVFLPIILYFLKYEESKVLYVISALFIFIAPTINMDNFLFIIPFVFLAVATGNSISMPKFKILLATSLLYIPLVFAPLIYSHQDVFGIFYWFYPLLHIRGQVIPIGQINNIILPAYNFFFMLLLYVSITILLLNNGGAQKNREDIILATTHRGKAENVIKEKINRKVAAILISAIIISVPLSLIYNEVNNSVSISNPETFPLLYFYPEYSINSSEVFPIGQNSYSVNGTILSIPKTTPSLLLERDLKSQSFMMQTFFILNDEKNLSTIASTNNWSIQVLNVFDSNHLSILPPQSLNETRSMNGTIPLVSGETQIYFFNGQSSIDYNISLPAIQDESLIWFFKPVRISQIQSLPIMIIYGNTHLEIALYQGYAVIAKNINGVWTQTDPIAFNLDEWQTVTLNIKANEVIIGFDGISYTSPLSLGTKYLSVVLGNPIPDHGGYSFIGYSTPIYYYGGSVSPYIKELSVNYQNVTYNIKEVQAPTTIVQMQFIDTPNESKLIIEGKNFTGEPSPFIWIGKDGGNGTVDIKIIRLIISYVESTGFYLVPAFLAFYLPFVFALPTTYHIIFRNIRYLEKKSK